MRFLSNSYSGTLLSRASLGALMLSRGARQTQSPMTFVNDPSGD